MSRKQKRLILGRDYRIDPDGACVLTREYLLSIGTCCDNRCRNCPYGDGEVAEIVPPPQPKEPDTRIGADS